MFSHPATSSDNLSKETATPLTTHSAPSTPLPATLSAISVHGCNWPSSDDIAYNTEFPWNTNSISPRTPSSAGLSDIFPCTNGYDSISSDTILAGKVLNVKGTSVHSRFMPRDTQLTSRHSEDQRTALRTRLKLKLPPVNQAALHQAALSAHLISRTTEVTITSDLETFKPNILKGLPNSAHTGDLNYNYSSMPRLAGSPSVYGDCPTRLQLGHNLSIPPSQMQEIQDGRRGTIALLTPPDELADLTTHALSTGFTSQPNLTTSMAQMTQDPTLPSTAMNIPAQNMSIEHQDEVMLLQEMTPVSSALTTLLADEKWLRSALLAMFQEHEKLVSSSYEALRIMVQSLPCPLPPPQQRRDKHKFGSDMPLSASAAPAMAAAAGYFFAPSTFSGSATTSTSNKAEHESKGISTALRILSTTLQEVYKVNDRPVYLQVSHAIPSNIPLSRLPTQPLTDSSMHTFRSTTSGSVHHSLFGNETSDMDNNAISAPPTVFNSIVIVRDLARDLGKIRPKSSLVKQPLPNPMLPPCSLHYSLLERYIPPPDTASDLELFSPTFSPLLDRTFELSSDGGCLLFIYPTKTGAKQFCENYLGPVLDPLLRRIMVMHHVKDDLLWQISRMIAVDNMMEFEGLVKRLNNFCEKLAQPNDNNGNSIGLSVNLIHAEKVQVQLNQHSWREWWAQQEQARIREVVKDYYSKATAEEERMMKDSINMRETTNFSGSTTSSFADTTISSIPQYNVPSDLVREIIDGVKASTIQPSSHSMREAVAASSMIGPGNAWPVVGQGTSNPSERMSDSKQENGIEMGIFVLRRTA